LKSLTAFWASSLDENSTWQKPLGSPVSWFMAILMLTISPADWKKFLIVSSSKTCWPKPPQKMEVDSPEGALFVEFAGGLLELWPPPPPEPQAELEASTWVAWAGSEPQAPPPAELEGASVVVPHAPESAAAVEA
jgi:hypothetical protein